MKRLILVAALSITLLILVLLTGRIAARRIEGGESRSGKQKTTRYPRVIIVSESALTHGIPYQYDTASSEAYRGIKEQLAAAGAWVVAREEFQPALLQEFTSPQMFFQGYPRLGLGKKADYILVFNITPGKPEPGGPIKREWAAISAHILDTASGRVWEAHHPKVTGEDEKTREAAFRKAAREAGKKVAKDLERILETKKGG